MTADGTDYGIRLEYMINRCPVAISLFNTLVSKAQVEVACVES
jgi:hypothetical protein